MAGTGSEMAVNGGAGLAGGSAARLEDDDEPVLARAQGRDGRPRPARPLDPGLERLIMAAHDHGVPIPMEAARIAAEAGYVPGMTVYGIGLANDGQIDAGTVWLDRADQAGDVMATVALGTLHMDHGRLTLADQYFTLAAMRGHQGAAAAWPSCGPVPGHQAQPPARVRARSRGRAGPKVQAGPPGRRRGSRARRRRIMPHGC